MRAEIGEQPEALARTIRELAEPVDHAAEELRRRGVTTVVTVARGSSANIARYAIYALGIHGRMLVADAAPSLVTAYDSPPPLEGTAVLAISQSGAGEDVRAVAEAGRAAGAPVLAVTNAGDSPLAAIADHALVTPAGREHSVPATKSYTSGLLVVAMLAGALARRGGTLAGLDEASQAAVPDAVARVLGREDELVEIGRALVPVRRCAVLGRGYDRATAAEIALKIQETSYVSAQDYGAQDFVHGPVAVVEPGFEVLAIAGAGPVASAVLDVTQRARRLGARVSLLSDGEIAGPDGPPSADRHIALDTGLSAPLAPLGFTVAGQLIALHLALASGTDPDRPRSLTKVTSTR